MCAYVCSYMCVCLSVLVCMYACVFTIVCFDIGVVEMSNFKLTVMYYIF